MACYRGHRTWQRGQVMSIYDNDDIRVLLVDYGETITSINACLRALPLFRGVPAKCRQVRVLGITCPEEHSAEVMEKFQDAVENEDLRVYPVLQEGECVRVCVRLSDDKDLAHLLHESGIAAWTDGECDEWRDVKSESKHYSSG